MQPQISLCIIAGNEAAHILRMLESFKDAFDELSLVSATGAEPIDDTVNLAEAWCLQERKGFVVSTYRNAEANAHWKHIDDFADARNFAFSQATGEWLLWCDCDDLLEGAAQVRQGTELGWDMVRYPYNVQEAGKTNLRERLIRASLFRDGRRWVGAVHESLPVAPGDKWGTSMDATWKHSPAGPKAGGTKRNLRILSAKVAEAPVDYYYIHQDWFYLGNATNAKRFGDIFLGLPLGPETLRYQCLLNLCEIEEVKETARAYAMRAWYLYPRSREALAYLVKCAFQDEKPEQAIMFAEIMSELPAPKIEDRHWWHEPRWYDWAGDDLLARAYRYGDDITAQAAQIRYYRGRKPTFSLIHATRGRCSQAMACRDIWLSFADNPRQVEHIFAIDADDTESKRWLKQFVRVEGGQGNAVSAWNEGALAATGAILIQLSDDWVPERGWDSKLLAEVLSPGANVAEMLEWDRHPQECEFVIAVSDGTRRDDLLCMAILSRARWEQQGKLMFSPEYESMYSDNEFSYRAFRDAVVIDARERIAFQHMHPAFGTARSDETYARTNAPERYERGRETFLRRNPEATLPCPT